MTFEEILDQAIALLQRRGRVTYRMLKFQFQLDDERLEALTESLIEAERLADDEAGRVLVWAPRASTPPRAATSITIRNVLVLLLACTAGAVDAVSYVGLGRVFTANMTGNTVLLGLALGQAESEAVVRSSLALVGFLAGVALGALTAHRGRGGGLWPPAVTHTLALEWVLLTAWAVWWYLAGDLDANHAARAALILPSALAMGVQSAVGRRLGIPGVATTYITGTLTALMARLINRLHGVPAFQTGPERAAGQTEPGAGLLAATWVLYIGGAAGAATAIAFLGSLAALVFPIGILTVVTLTGTSAFRRP
jgi:uncharacterized membrane protein YoaK (UPF0700 family)